jgi:predicted esterase
MMSSRSRTVRSARIAIVLATSTFAASDVATTTFATGAFAASRVAASTYAANADSKTSVDATTNSASLVSSPTAAAEPFAAAARENAVATSIVASGNIAVFSKACESENGAVADAARAHDIIATHVVANSTDDLPGKPPDAFAPAHKAFGWNSKNDLRFVWWLPEGFDRNAPHTLTVILHGRGFDYRWGWKNHPPELFRPADVVISVDGTSPDGDHRWFAPEKKDADAFQAFLVEMTQTFGTDRTLLYGHVEGGAFALTFAGEHPDAITGVVAHDSAPPAPPKLAPDAKKPAIVFLHGTLDPEACIELALEARNAWSKAGFPLVHLRRLEGASYEPNPRRSRDALDWCDAMTTDKPQISLDAALALVHVEGDARARTPADFAGARAILRRFESKGAPVFSAAPPAELSSRAASVAAAIEAAGAEHVGALKKAIPKKKDLKLDAKLPIGHLAAVREDFRGVSSVEAYMDELGYDALFESQTKHAVAILDAWRKSRDPKTTFETVLDHVPSAWLHGGLPTDLSEKMRAWKADAKKLGASGKALKNWPVFEDWRRSWEDGLQQYAALWKEWKGP